jgi:hypothetical protein
MSAVSLTLTGFARSKRNVLASSSLPRDFSLSNILRLPLPLK